MDAGVVKMIEQKQTNKIEDDKRYNLIKEIVGATQKLKKVPLEIIIKATTGYRLIPLEEVTNFKDGELFDELCKVGKTFKKEAIDMTRLEAPRINELGKKMAKKVADEISKGKMSAKELGEGYPNVVITQNKNRVSYLSVKSTQGKWNSTFRSFYYTDGKHIENDARHLLICFDVEKNKQNNLWRVIDYVIIDLLRVNLSLKAEFNISNKCLYPQKQQKSKYAKIKQPRIDKWL